MYYPEIHPAGPVVSSQWETIGPRHIQYDPAEYVSRMYSWPSEYRGQRFVNPVPYNQKFVFPMSGTENGAVTNGHPLDQKMALLLLVVGIGIIAYFLGKSNSSAPRRNPYCWVPESRMRPRRRITKTARKARRRRANRQPRDEFGRFVPTE